MASPEPLGPEERRRLDEHDVRTLLEYLAARLGHAAGNVRLEFAFTNGSLRQTSMHAGPIRNAELEALAARSPETSEGSGSHPACDRACSDRVTPGPA